MRVKLYENYYDLSDFNHPGGKEVIKYIDKIPDATPYFESYHKEGQRYVEIKFKKYKIQESEKVIESNNLDVYDYTHYKEIKRIVQTYLSVNKCETKYRTFEKFIFIVQAFLITSLMSLSHPIFHVVSGILNIGFSVGLLHSGGHHAISKNNRINYFLYNLGCIFSGIIPLESWKVNHNYYHHLYTGTKFDPDIDNYAPHFLTHPKSKYEKRKLSKFSKCFYFIFVFCWQWFGILKQHFKWIIMRGGIRGFLGILDFQSYFNISTILSICIYIFYLYKSPVHFVCFVLGMNLGFSSIVLPNHYTNKTYKTNVESNDWAIKQITESANFCTNNYFITYFFGGINYQIEHHLFPSFSPYTLGCIQPLIKKYCNENGITYNEFGSWFGALNNFRENLFENN
jgi:linoleoyl-CoA desaturase